MLKPLTTTLSSSCLGSGVRIHHVYFTKHGDLIRSYEGSRFTKTSKGSLHFNSDEQSFSRIGRLKTRCQHQQHVFPNNIAHISADGTHQDQNDVSKATLIWRAIKLPIYSVALVPLTF